MASRGDESVAADLFTMEMSFEGANGSSVMVFGGLETNAAIIPVEIGIASARSDDGQLATPAEKCFEDTVAM